MAKKTGKSIYEKTYGNEMKTVKSVASGKVDSGKKK